MTKSKTTNKKSSYTKFAIALVILGAIGLLASFALTLEKIDLLKNPKTQLNCDINPIVSCGSVIESDQAEAFGFANPLIGLIGFSVVITIGMGVIAGARYKRWFWIGLNIGAGLAGLFVIWLFYQSVFDIGALCPLCMVVWAVTIPILVYVKRFNIIEGHIKYPKQLSSVVNSLIKYPLVYVLVWYAIFIAIIANQFWYYWKTLV